MSEQDLLLHWMLLQKKKVMLERMLNQTREMLRLKLALCQWLWQKEHYQMKAQRQKLV